MPPSRTATRSRAGDQKKPQKAVARAPRQMTERRLENIAVFYLQRFTTTAAQLRRVLIRRIDRTLYALGATADATAGATRAEMSAWVDTLVARLVVSNAVNDHAYAEGRVAMMRRLGKSPGKIRAALKAKGIASAVIDQILAATAESADGGDVDLAAAIAYAKRRRLGPFRQDGRDRDTDRRDLGALARAGFSLSVARAALQHTREDA